jgi:bifunctional DNA primase/polymerase-like protein/primase-like protein
MLQWALKAQARGLWIFPVAPGAKVPHPAAGQWGETATNDISQITYFWTQVDPKANVGIACKQSELLVVDLDRPKTDFKLRGTEWEYLHEGYGPVVTGEELWDEMLFKLGGGQPVDTYTVRTGSGGTHLYYQWPSWWPKISQASPVKGVIDVRGNGGQYGGYVLAEGSVTESGPYYHLFNGHGPMLAPEWLRQLVAERPQQPAVRRPGGIRQPSAVSWSGLVDSVRHAGEGNRNNALLWAARAMCSDGAPESEAMSVLGDAAQDAGLPYFEIERTIQSAYRIQRQKEGL